MPALSQLMAGPTYTILQNVVYAMPYRAVKGFFLGSTGLESNVNGTTTTNWQAVTVTAGEFNTSAPFIRCTHAAGGTIRLVEL